ncbi:hypothetical protein [Nocardioides mangrovi]|uniref:ATP-binding protein n=1 Tax=Nocardioides mangrovi TaxID=2874580 RepID=A0ABS7U9G8_9ACTN|nr:hypothetical protein [Nocardioides mangrovi]MBZ5737512.1 hypothetical protein [Nocardioides mangrovi]
MANDIKTAADVSSGGPTARGSSPPARLPEIWDSAAQWVAYGLARGLTSERIRHDKSLLYVDGKPVDTYDARDAIGRALESHSSATPAPAPSGQRPKQQEKGPGLKQIIAHIEDHFDFYLTEDGDLFAIEVGAPALPIMLGARGTRLARKVKAHFWNEKDANVPGKVLDDAMEILIAKWAEAGERVTLHLRAYADGGLVVIDLGIPGSSRCVAIRPGNWSVEDQPPAGIFFRRPASLQPLPEPAEDGSWDGFRETLGLAADDERWLLARGWLVASVFGDVPRPILFPIGPPGSGKTNTGHAIVNVLDPRKELGSSFGKSLDDDQVKASSRFLVGYDNLTSVSENLSDHVCRLVTGDSTEKRTLYSDDGLTVLAYKRTGVMTAVTLPYFRSDALERVIPLYFERRETKVAERALRSAFEAAHPAALAALCDGVARVLDRLPDVMAANPQGPRMVDYWMVLLAHDEQCAEAYRLSTKSTLREAGEQDPFASAIRDWVATDALCIKSGTATDLLVAWKRWMGEAGNFFGPHDTYVPRDGTRFSAALTRATETLAAIGVRVDSRKSNGRRVTTINYLKPEEDQ